VVVGAGVLVSLCGKREVEGINREEDELPGGAVAAVDSFQVQASGQEASSGTVLMLAGVGLGLATGFLARAASLAARPAKAYARRCSLPSPTILRRYLRRYRRRPGTLSSLRAMPYPSWRALRTYLRTYSRIHTRITVHVSVWYFFRSLRAVTARVCV